MQNHPLFYQAKCIFALTMQRNPPLWRAPYGWSYRHWTSLKLNARQLNVLRRLEMQRITQGYIRIYVGDVDINDNLSSFLIDYVAWLSTRINPYARTLILNRYKKQARIDALKIPRCKALTSFEPTHTRGHSGQHLLLLNADLYGFAWSADVTGHLRRHLFPAIPDCPGTAIIVHGNLDSSRNPQFSIEFYKSMCGIYGPYWQAVHPYAPPEHRQHSTPKLRHHLVLTIFTVPIVPTIPADTVVLNSPIHTLPPVLAAAAAA